jgi:hypothetical protein
MIDYFKLGNKRRILIKAGHMFIKSFTGKSLHHRVATFCIKEVYELRVIAKESCFSRCFV